MTLDDLEVILSYQFGPPFLAEGHVNAEFKQTQDGRILQVNIDRRDVWIDENGKVVAAGTRLSDPYPVGPSAKVSK
jgi:hypothetical protein